MRINFGAKIIVMDYDGTYTVAPTLWKSVINAFRLDGWQVWIVTERKPAENDKGCQALSQLVDLFLFTAGEAKRDWLIRKHYLPDDFVQRRDYYQLKLIWIEDRPDRIFNELRLDF